MPYQPCAVCGRHLIRVTADETPLCHHHHQQAEAKPKRRRKAAQVEVDDDPPTE